MKPPCSQATTPPPPHYVLHHLKPVSPRPLVWALLNTGSLHLPSTQLTDITSSEDLRGSVTLRSHSLLAAKLGFATSAVSLSQDTDSKV